MSVKFNRMVVFAAALAVVAVLGSTVVSYAQRNAAAKANGEYNTGFWNSNQSWNGNARSQNSNSRQSYSYDPSKSDDVAARGSSCSPKLNYKAGDEAQKQTSKKAQKQSGKQAPKQAQKQQSRRSFSQQPSDQSSKSAKSNKSAKSDVAARGPGCSPKLNYKAGDANSQAQKDSRRSYSYDSEQQSNSGNNSPNEGHKYPWQYQKTSPHRYQN